LFVREELVSRRKRDQSDRIRARVTRSFGAESARRAGPCYRFRFGARGVTARARTRGTFFARDTTG
jgi:hypothetical protein